MKQFFLTIGGVFAGLLLFFVGAPFLLIVFAVGAARPAPTPPHAVLELDLRSPLSDQDAASPLAFLSAPGQSVMSVVSGLRRASRDDAVRALLIRLPEAGMAPAAADALRAAVLDFRRAGKAVIAHSQGLYPSGQPVATYMLGVASGSLWMQPAASIQAVGAANEDMFFKRAFDKYGVEADFEQRAQYKNAVNPYLYDDYTPAHREASLGWMNSVYTSEIAAAAHDRRTSPQAMRTALESGPYLAETALDRRLIDHVGQVSEAEAALESVAGEGATMVRFASYLGAERRRQTPHHADGQVALIQAEGEISTGSSRDSGLNGGGGVRSDDVAQAFKRAIADSAVKAIVFRISSPGGSDTASEQILNAVRAAEAAKKPVVVSMGTYAASGGYWIASQASEIVAEPTTLTGSIGVFGGKFVIGPALARFGVDTRGLAVGGAYADAFGSAKPFTASQRAAFSRWMDQIYAGFLARVATGRHLSVSRVAQIAKGRVWTGVQALPLGLIDKLGGVELATAEARRLAGLPATDDALQPIEARSSPFQALARAFGQARATAAVGASAAGWISDPRIQSLVTSLAHAQLRADGRGAVLADLPAW